MRKRWRPCSRDSALFFCDVRSLPCGHTPPRKLKNRVTMPTTPPVSADTKLGLVRLSLLAVATGLITGLGAVLFRMLIAAIHNLFFLGIFSFSYDANIFTPPGPWGAWIILAPVI